MEENQKKMIQKIGKKWMKKAAKPVANGLLFLLFPILNFYLLEFYTHNPFEEVRSFAQFANVMLFLLLQTVFFFLFGKLRVAVRIEMGITMIYGIANAYVTAFRTNPIVPWDVLSLKTATSVAGNYDFAPSRRMVVVTVSYLLILIGVQFVKLTCRSISLWKRCGFGIITVVVLCLFCNSLQTESFQNRHLLYNKLFTPVYMTNVDGIAVTFVMNLAYMAIEKPAGYNSETAKETLSAYESQVTEQEEEVSDEELPNIIVIMNESFSDLAVLGDFTTNEDYMPYLHQLQKGEKNTVTGMLNVSVCGGNTANTEFEFLTGNTMAFLPQGSIAYQQYITGDLPAIPSYLASLGYETYATHPYYASGWDRNTVYPKLGFEHMDFIDSYESPTYIRKYISDDSCVDKIISLYEKKKQGTPMFLFNVTMQNHGGYSEKSYNFTPDIKVDGVSNFSLEQYLSLVKRSDEALERLISYFKETDEKTIVVFFGDHQPSDLVASSILNLNGMTTTTLTEEETKLRYEVPYVIWANYDIGEETNADTSANYLGLEVLEKAGITLPAYQNFLKETKEKYPILSAVRITNQDSEETSKKKESEGLNLYQQLQYYLLFDLEE